MGRPFQGGKSLNQLQLHNKKSNLKLSNALKCETTETDIAKLVDQLIEKYQQVSDNILQAYHK